MHPFCFFSFYSRKWLPKELATSTFNLALSKLMDVHLYVNSISHFFFVWIHFFAERKGQFSAKLIQILLIIQLNYIFKKGASYHDIYRIDRPLLMSVIGAPIDWFLRDTNIYAPCGDSKYCDVSSFTCSIFRQVT